MKPILVTLAPQASHVRILMMGPEGEMMRAVLGPPARMHPKAASTLLEGLALWQQQPLSVVLYVDGPDDGCAMGLSEFAQRVEGLKRDRDALQLLVDAQRSRGYELCPRDGGQGVIVLGNRRVRDRIAVAQTPDGRWVGVASGTSTLQRTRALPIHVKLRGRPASACTHGWQPRRDGRLFESMGSSTWSFLRPRPGELRPLAQSAAESFLSDGGRLPADAEGFVRYGQVIVSLQDHRAVEVLRVGFFQFHARIAAPDRSEVLQLDAGHLAVFVGGDKHEQEANASPTLRNTSLRASGPWP